MKKNKVKKSGAGGTVLDLVLIILAAACVFSAVFSEQIRTFLGEKKEVTVEYTFLVENASDKTASKPLRGEEIVSLENGVILGVIQSVEEKGSTFVSEADPEDKNTLSTFTCKARVLAEETERGYDVSGIVVKPGASVAVKTQTASFTMMLISTKTVEEE